MMYLFHILYDNDDSHSTKNFREKIWTNNINFRVPISKISTQSTVLTVFWIMFKNLFTASVFDRKLLLFKYNTRNVCLT